MADSAGDAMRSLIRTPLLLRPPPACTTRCAAFDCAPLPLLLTLALLLLLFLPDLGIWSPARIEDSPPPPMGASVMSPEGSDMLRCGAADTKISFTTPLLLRLRLLLLLLLREGCRSCASRCCWLLCPDARGCTGCTPLVGMPCGPISTPASPSRLPLLPSVIPVSSSTTAAAGAGAGAGAGACSDLEREPITVVGAAACTDGSWLI